MLEARGKWLFWLHFQRGNRVQLKFKTIQVSKGNKQESVNGFQLKEISIIIAFHEINFIQEMRLHFECMCDIERLNFRKHFSKYSKKRIEYGNYDLFTAI